jgi:hypothetical protein
MFYFWAECKVRDTGDTLQMRLYALAPFHFLDSRRRAPLALFVALVPAPDLSRGRPCLRSPTVFIQRLFCWRLKDYLGPNFAHAPLA